MGLCAMTAWMFAESWVPKCACSAAYVKIKVKPPYIQIQREIE